MILDHINTEFSKIYTTLSHPIYASFSLFIKNGLWSFVLLSFFYLNIIENLSLQIIFNFWIIGQIISLVINCINILKLDNPMGHFQFNHTFLIKGMKMSAPFFIGSISFKIIEFSNRYFIKDILSYDDLGIYTYYTNLANPIHTFVFTAVTMFIYPKMIMAYNNKEFNDYKNHLSMFRLLTVIYTVLFSIIILFIDPYLIGYLGKSEIGHNKMILYILLIGYSMWNFSSIPHYRLYILGYDKILMIINVIAALLCIGLNFYLINTYHLQGAAVSFTTVFTLIFFAKYISVKYYNKFHFS